MGTWTKQDRFNALLSGEKADRPIISGWRHFIDKEQNANDLTSSTVNFTKKYNWDWVKINPRATYLAEIWGNEYDFTDYHSVFPRQLTTILPKPSDVWKLEARKVFKSSSLLEQLAACKNIRTELPEIPLTQTIFSPLSVLLFIAGRSAYVYETVFGIDTPVTFESLFVENRSGVHHALHVIVLTIAEYVQELDRVGINGLFYAVTGTANPNLFDEAAFNEFSRPYDLIVLEAAQNGKRILHTCGPNAQPEKFNDYPIEGISWDTKATGNPSLLANVKATVVGGVDHHLFAENHVKTITNETKNALKLMENKPFIVAPNCAIPLNVTEETLYAFRKSITEKEITK
ncbi:uroporphyrinogen decarboxylase family protein [Niallia alba]|uniref:Uroporphyrinogen-III decarboxylase n=1 Tax=Niallia alba TaxID=2729105 RepID=A0A7Y0PLF8_9BACI|nr:uroporphyrinogen decarboxylase family protein [Niallia alba]NMO76952.1 uroporphyrinogen-III decarboxylase [Niallia alba]